MIDPAASIVLPVLRQEDAGLEPTAVEACLSRAADIVSTWKRSYPADGVTEFPRLRRQLEWARFDALPIPLEHGASVDIVEQFCYNRRDHAGDRLTTRPPDESRAALGRILDKHGVFSVERERLLRAKARWFGRPTHVVVAEGHGGGTG